MLVGFVPVVGDDTVDSGGHASTEGSVSDGGVSGYVVVFAVGEEESVGEEPVEAVFPQVLVVEEKICAQLVYDDQDVKGFFVGLRNGDLGWAGLAAGCGECAGEECGEDEGWQVGACRGLGVHGLGMVVGGGLGICSA